MSDNNSNIEKSKSIKNFIALAVTTYVGVCTALEIILSFAVKSAVLDIVIAVLIIAGAFIFGRHLARRIADPLEDIAGRMVRLAEKGDLTSPVNIPDTRDEIAVMACSADITIKAMKDYIERISDGLENIAQGNLTKEIRGEWTGDFAQLRTSYNKIIVDFCSMFAEIGDASGQVNDGSQQVADDAKQLSAGTTQQADSIEKLSAQLADISEKVTANARAARNTSDLVRNTTDQINLCSQEMSEMLDAIRDINSSSNEISKIMKVIDDIAFQTNILALNASVEAAHAGPAGKGFAVVADEVRNLANKSAEASSQTNKLIQDSIDSIERGTRIAMKTARALDGIVEGAKGISEEVENISESTESQTLAITQISDGVGEISEVVRRNSTTAEESAQTSQQLSGQSSILRNILSRFRYDRETEPESGNEFSSGGTGTIDLDGDSYSGSSYDSYDSYSGSSYGSSDSYGSSSYDSTDSYGGSSYGSADSYGGSSYDSTDSYGGSSFGSADSYSSSSYDSTDSSGGSSYESPDSGSSFGSLSYSAPSVKTEKPRSLTFGDNQGDDDDDDGSAPFTPIDFNGYKHEDDDGSAPTIVLDDDYDFENVVSKY